MTGRYLTQDRGFTLLEGLITLSIFLIVMFAIYTTFASGAGTFAKGDVKAEIHQNARASMDFMSRELRHAGFFPENFPTVLPPGPGVPVGGCPNAFPGFIGISTATATQITICGDIDGDNSSELVTYSYFGDINGDGIVDPGENEIRRQLTDETGVQAVDVVALHISNPGGQPLFTYFNGLNAQIAPGFPVPGSGACPDNVSPGCDIARIVITMTGSQPQQQSAAIGGRSQSPFATRVQNYQLITDVRPRNLLL